MAIDIYLACQSHGPIPVVELHESLDRGRNGEIREAGLRRSRTTLT